MDPESIELAELLSQCFGKDLGYKNSISRTLELGLYVLAYNYFKALRMWVELDTEVKDFLKGRGLLEQYIKMVDERIKEYYYTLMRKAKWIVPWGEELNERT